MKINIKNMSQEEWLEKRKIGIGGSDAAAIAGLNPWKSPFQIYLEKTNQLHNNSIDNERMRIGRDLEEYVAKRFEEATNKKVRRNNHLLISDSYPFMIANVDREVVGENAVLECKITSNYAKKNWENGKIPIHYELQVLHYMAVGGYNKGYIAVLIGNEAFEFREIERDEETIEYLISIEQKFWKENVLKGIIPEPDGSDNYTETLKEKYKGGNIEEVFLDFSEDEIQRLIELKKIDKEYQTEIKKIEQKIQKKMGDHEVAKTSNFTFSWKNQTRKSFDSKKLKENDLNTYNKYIKQTENRVFRVNKKENKND